MFQELSYLATNCIELAKCNLMLTWYKKAEAKTANTNFTWLYFVFPNNFVFPYFNSSILYSVHLFGKQILELFPLS